MNSTKIKSLPSVLNLRPNNSKHLEKLSKLNYGILQVRSDTKLQAPHSIVEQKHAFQFMISQTQLLSTVWQPGNRISQTKLCPKIHQTFLFSFLATKRIKKTKDKSVNSRLKNGVSVKEPYHGKKPQHLTHCAQKRHLTEQLIRFSKLLLNPLSSKQKIPQLKCEQ